MCWESTLENVLTFDGIICKLTLQKTNMTGFQNPSLFNRRYIIYIYIFIHGCFSSSSHVKFFGVRRVRKPTAGSPHVLFSSSFRVPGSQKSSGNVLLFSFGGDGEGGNLLTRPKIQLSFFFFVLRIFLGMNDEGIYLEQGVPF